MQNKRTRETHAREVVSKKLCRTLLLLFKAPSDVFDTQKKKTVKVIPVFDYDDNLCNKMTMLREMMSVRQHSTTTSIQAVITNQNQITERERETSKMKTYSDPTGVFVAYIIIATSTTTTTTTTTTATTTISAK